MLSVLNIRNIICTNQSQKEPPPSDIRGSAGLISHFAFCCLDPAKNSFGIERGRARSLRDARCLCCAARISVPLDLPLSLPRQTIPDGLAVEGRVRLSFRF